MTAGYNAEKVANLARKIMHHKRLYYAGKPEISDQEFDRLEDELRCLAPQHPVLEFVGADVSSGAPKVTHEVPILSLQKTYDEEDLLSWVDDREVVGTWKIDGNCLSLIYQDGSFQQAKTRGNGRVGEDVTEKARWVSDVVPKLSNEISLEVRGELYCSEHHFAQLVEEMIALRLERPTSARNIVAGLLGRKTHFNLARYFNFLAFDVTPRGGSLPFKTEIEKYSWLGKQGFNLPGPELLQDKKAVNQYLEHVRHAMAESEIGLDGAVFSYNSLALQDELGSTSHHPRYKMSFKWQGQTAVAKINSILWNTSRFGIVTPVAVIDPVQLSGAKITNITLHNAEHVKAYNLKIGDKIEVVRSGEVIPKFLQVVESAAGQYEFPTACPSCSATLAFDEIRLKCPNNDSCPAQQMRGILAWIRAAEIDDLSEKRLDNMIQLGLVNTIPDLYRLTVEDFLKLPLTSDKMAGKLFNNIKGSRKMPLSHFLTGLGVEGMGRTSWEKILQHFSTLRRLQEMTVEDLVAIEGFAQKSAEQIVASLAVKKGLITELLEVGVKPVAEQTAPQAGPLSGKNFVITGALSRPRAEVEKIIKSAGGHLQSSVSKVTFALVTNEADSTSSKMKKAQQLGILIWSEDKLYDFIDKKEDPQKVAAASPGNIDPPRDQG